MTHDVQMLFENAYQFEVCLETKKNDTCDSCKHDYSTLNTWYTRIEDDYQGNVCLDVTAVMVNYRGKWFSLGCISPRAYDLFAIIIGICVLIAGLALYGCSLRYAHGDRPELLIRESPAATSYSSSF